MKKDMKGEILDLREEIKEYHDEKKGDKIHDIKEAQKEDKTKSVGKDEKTDVKKEEAKAADDKKA